ncbi:protein JTB [Ischnura elegans]|uniref:protein JTB n=1 Tax=Ischnura elegans TaxID=197161 RepID=UPI001ED8A081|nr:protein JTB [Ischnura elegans]
MIESCSKRRMLLAVTFLGGLTLLVLVVESHWTNGTKKAYPETHTRNTSLSSCWLKEDYEIVEPCHLCNAFEINSLSVPACLQTHYKEVINCNVSGKVQRSCDRVAWIEERNFWIFEGLMLVFGSVSITAVFTRQKILDHRVLRRLQRQLASGV